MALLLGAAEGLLEIP